MDIGNSPQAKEPDQTSPTNFAAETTLMEKRRQAQSMSYLMKQQQHTKEIPSPSELNR